MGYWRSLTSYMYYSLVCIFGSFIKHSCFVKEENFSDLRPSFYFGREVRRKSTRNYYNCLTWYVFFLFYSLKNILIVDLDLMTLFGEEYFFLVTGFHGLHVLIGTLFLISCLISILFQRRFNNHHIGIEIRS